MKITRQWLQEQGACADGERWFLSQRATELRTVVMKLMKARRPDWANWTIIRFMSPIQKVYYAAFAAKQVLHLFEAQHPDDKRPRAAIEAALRFAEQPTPENRAAANAAYAAANAAANAAYAAYYTANAAYAAYYATDAANAANAAYAAHYATDAANAAKRKIVFYGLRLVYASTGVKK